MTCDTAGSLGTLAHRSLAACNCNYHACDLVMVMRFLRFVGGYTSYKAFMAAVCSLQVQPRRRCGWAGLALRCLPPTGCERVRVRGENRGWRRGRVGLVGRKLGWPAEASEAVP